MSAMHVVAGNFGYDQNHYHLQSYYCSSKSNASRCRCSFIHFKRCRCGQLPFSFHRRCLLPKPMGKLQARQVDSGHRTGSCYRLNFIHEGGRWDRAHNDCLIRCLRFIDHDPGEFKPMLNLSLKLITHLRTPYQMMRIWLTSAYIAPTSA